MNILKFTALAAVLLLAACAENPSGSDGDPNAGEVRFSYTSANSPLSGTFQAEGAPPPTGGTGEEWAAGTSLNEVGQTVAFGIVPLTAGKYDQVSVYFPDAGVGTYSTSSDCEGDGCAGVLFSMANSTGGMPAWVCTAVSGSVQVTSVAGGRVRGTFTGGSRCYSPASPGNEPELQITSGSFDVALLEFPA